MRNIQDKDFDQQFRDQLEDAEMEPSADLWDRIETQLGDKPRRGSRIWWLAAALLLAALAAGLLFYPSENLVKPEIVYRRNSIPAVGSVKQPKILQTQRISPAHLTAPVQQAAIAGIRAAVKAAHGNTLALPEAGSVAPVVTDRKITLVAMQPSGLIPHPVTKEVNVKQEKFSLPAVMEDAGTDNLLAATGPGAGNRGDEVINENDSNTASKGIRNIGDLVNYVVDKVDKREEKFLQFKTDDDNSSLVAINIGIIRFNTKKTHTNK